MSDLPTGTVTFLFTDIEGSTGLWQQHRDAMSAALARHHAILQNAIESHDGYVFQIIGDAFCAAFSTAADALAATIDAQRALLAEAWGTMGTLRVRMGLHTGVAEVHLDDVKAGQYASGLTLSRAQRIMSAGYGGQILVSSTTSELLRGALPEGVALRDLSEHRLKGLLNPEHLWQMIGPDLPPEFPPLQSLNTIPNNYFREKTALLVLDNCEHVIDACAQLTEHLLTQCPDLRVLASSREALGIEGEAALRVPSLSLPPSGASTREALGHSEAAQLFLDRATMALPGFTPTYANASAIAQICRRLDGIPLAIELAASRVKLVKVEQIAARLDDAFRLLTGGSRTALPRQQTLRATIDWSYNLLTEAERTLLRRLAVFAGGGTLEAVEAVCAQVGQDAILPYDVLDLMSQLVNKSLVMAEDGQVDEPRYLLLETIRQYAREKLNDSGEGEAVRERHTRWCVELAERAEPKFHGHGQLEWLDRMEREHDNMRAALEWSLNNDIELGLRTANALTWFWHLRGHAIEGHQHMEKLLAAGPLGPSLLYAGALSWAGWLC